MQIRIKPQVVHSNNGFDFVGRPTQHKEVHRTIAKLQNEHWRSIREGKQNGLFVYWKEKHRGRTKTEQLITKSGKPSKKTKTTNIPTHWKYKIWFIPDTVIQLLKQEGKYVKQFKNHWSIVSSK